MLKEEFLFNEEVEVEGKRSRSNRIDFEFWNMVFGDRSIMKVVSEKDV